LTCAGQAGSLHSDRRSRLLVTDSHPHDLAELARLRPRPDIRLIATDMDGTLVDDAKQIHDELWPLVDELFARGITFCPASGRQYENLRKQFADVADELVFIAENGTYVVARGRELSSDGLALDVERRDPQFVAEVGHYYANLEVVPDLLEVEGDDVLKVTVYDFVSAEHNAAPRLADLAPAQNIVVSGPHWMDLTSPTANKGAAVRAVQRALGVTPDQTMAFGDFLNDVEMMTAATYSFAMANAHPLLKERASWVAPANNANGVVRTIRAVLGLG
jgi:HAD superfamily hydrolase (TIGR01484 family)